MTGIQLRWSFERVFTCFINAPYGPSDPADVNVGRVEATSV